MTTRLAYFIRHGQTDWNAEGRFQGQIDTCINSVGRSQAERNGRLLSGLVGGADRFDFVASPLKRTCETMRILRRAMGLAPDAFRTDARLVEVHFGDWQGQTMAEIEARQPGTGAARDRDKWHFLPPGKDAESYEMLTRRIAPWLEELSRPTICVTHGGVMRALFRLVEEWPPEEVAAMIVPQDRILVLEGRRLSWRG
jgi:broad specificity phosphatase PhoE